MGGIMGLVDWLRRNILVIFAFAAFLSPPLIVMLTALDVYLINTSPEFDYLAIKSVVSVENGEVVSVDGRTIYVSLNQSFQSFITLRYRLRHLNDRFAISFSKADVKFIGDGCLVLSRSYRDEVVLEVLLANHCNLTIAIRVDATLSERGVAIGRYRVTDIFKFVTSDDTSQSTSYTVELTPMLIEYEYTSVLRERIIIPAVIIASLVVFFIIISRQ